jgi:GNAT superfamily N-acetyltransferase
MQNQKHSREMTVRICNVSRKTLPSCLFIAENQLGKDYLMEKDILESGIYSVCGVIHEDVVGFATGNILDQQCLASQYPRIAEDLPDTWLQDNRIGIVASVAVKPDHQRLGIGTTLVRKVVQHFDDQNITRAIMLGWMAPDGVHIARIASVLWFTEKAVIPEYWHEDSLSRGYLCPVCGHPTVPLLRRPVCQASARSQVNPYFHEHFRKEKRR